MGRSVIRHDAVRSALFAIAAAALLSCGPPAIPNAIDPTTGALVEFVAPADGGTILFEWDESQVWLGESQVRRLIADFQDSGKFKARTRRFDPLFMDSLRGSRVLTHEFGPVARRLILMRALDERIARIEFDGEEFRRLLVRDVRSECSAVREFVADDGRVVLRHGLYIGEC